MLPFVGIPGQTIALYLYPKRSDDGLVLVVVRERLKLRMRTLAHPVLVRIKALDQFRKHSHNTYQHFFAGLNRI